MSQKLEDGIYEHKDGKHILIYVEADTFRSVKGTAARSPLSDLADVSRWRRIATLDGTPVVDEGVIEAIMREFRPDTINRDAFENTLRKHLCTEKREAGGEDVSEKPGDSAIESNDAVTRHHRIAAHNYGAMFCWCVKNLKKFPPRPGVEWVDDVKERLLERDQLQARIAELEAAPTTNRYRETATGDVWVKRPQIFLDCDGVLADFDSAFRSHFGCLPPEYEDRHGSDKFWADLQNAMPNFYRELPLMADARELFDAVKHLRPIILTGCPRGEWAELQKLKWAAEHFPGVPMIVCRSKDKSHYLRPGDVLIDDRPHYRDLWEKSGGVFIHHRNAAESLQELASRFTPIAHSPKPIVDLPGAEPAVGARLFVIRQAGTDNYWNCSTEHGCGWNPGHPKQSFSKSELAKEVFRIADNYPQSIEIDELKIGRKVLATCADD